MAQPLQGPAGVPLAATGPLTEAEAVRRCAMAVEAYEDQLRTLNVADPVGTALDMGPSGALWVYWHPKHSARPGVPAGRIRYTVQSTGATPNANGPMDDAATCLTLTTLSLIVSRLPQLLANADRVVREANAKRVTAVRRADDALAVLEAYAAGDPNFADKKRSGA